MKKTRRRPRIRCHAIESLERLCESHLPSYIAYKLGIRSTKTLDNWIVRDAVSERYKEEVIKLADKLGVNK